MARTEKDRKEAARQFHLKKSGTSKHRRGMERAASDRMPPEAKVNGGPARGRGSRSVRFPNLSSSAQDGRYWLSMAREVTNRTVAVLDHPRPLIVDTNVFTWANEHGHPDCRNIVQLISVGFFRLCKTNHLFNEFINVFTTNQEIIWRFETDLPSKNLLFRLMEEAFDLTDQSFDLAYHRCEDGGDNMLFIALQKLNKASQGGGVIITEDRKHVLPMREEYVDLKDRILTPSEAMVKYIKNSGKI